MHTKMLAVVLSEVSGGFSFLPYFLHFSPRNQPAQGLSLSSPCQGRRDPPPALEMGRNSGHSVPGTCRGSCLCLQPISWRGHPGPWLFQSLPLSPLRPPHSGYSVWIAVASSCPTLPATCLLRLVPPLVPFATPHMEQGRCLSHCLPHPAWVSVSVCEQVTFPG